MRTISFIQRTIPHYRVRFFETLHVMAGPAGLALTVYSGEGPEAGKAWGFAHKTLPVRRLGHREGALCWLGGLDRAVAGSDVIVAPQELQCLNVPYLWIRRRTLCNHWIWFGHGHNYQASLRPGWASRLKERVRRFMTRRADGLLSYTQQGAAYWRQEGMPVDWAVPFLNTLDVEGLRKAGADLSQEHLAKARHELGIEGKKVLLFSGRLYVQKEVDFLLRALALLQERRPDTALLILGDGEERRRLEALRDRLNLRHVHFLGSVVDPSESSLYFRLADLLVIPGLVGLAIVHGFAFGLPLVTTERDFHSPEIDYLGSETGAMTTHDEQAYARTIESLLSSPDLLRSMQTCAARLGDRLTLARSAERLLDGLNRLCERPST